MSGTSPKVLDALVLLRLASNPGAPELSVAWKTVSEYLGTFGLGVGAMHRDDIRQRALLKVLHHVSRFSGERETSAHHWLRQIHRSAVSDYFRLQGRRALERALALGEGDRWNPSRRRTLRGRTRRSYERSSTGYSTGWSTGSTTGRATHPSAWGHTAGAGGTHGQRLGLGLAEIRSAAGLDPETPSNAALSKWIERGRETVVLPAIAEWDDPLAEPLAEILHDARRGDAGRPRPARRSVVSHRSAHPSEKSGDHKG